jgi:hypothetical protein
MGYMQREIDDYESEWLAVSEEKEQLTLELDRLVNRA